MNIREAMKPMEDKAMSNFEKFSNNSYFGNTIEMPAAYIGLTQIPQNLIQFVKGSVKHFSNVLNRDRMKAVSKALISNCKSGIVLSFEKILQETEASQELEQFNDSKLVMNDDPPTKSESFKNFHEFYRNIPVPEPSPTFVMKISPSNYTPRYYYEPRPRKVLHTYHTAGGFFTRSEYVTVPQRRYGRRGYGYY